MKIANQHIVELKYTLRKDNPNGEIMEIMDEHWPFKFLFGSGVLIPAFEKHLEGLEDGATFEFTLSAKEAYGEVDPSKTVQLFRDDIEKDHRYPMENYEEGDLISVTTSLGERITGKLKALKAKYILVDTNHAMAGLNLHFEGQVLNVRKARTDELVHKRYIEPNGIRSDSRLSEPPNE